MFIIIEMLLLISFYICTIASMEIEDSLHSISISINVSLSYFKLIYQLSISMQQSD
jgi:hypothetical protein